MSNQQQEHFKLECINVGYESESGMAISVVPACTGQSIWIPLSQVHEICRNGSPPYLYVTPWIARQKGLL